MADHLSSHLPPLDNPDHGSPRLVARPAKLCQAERAAAKVGGGYRLGDTPHDLVVHDDFCTAGLRNRPSEEKSYAMHAFNRSVVPLIANGLVSSPVDRIFPVEDVVDVFDHLASSGKFGKVLIRL